MSRTKKERKTRKGQHISLNVGMRVLPSLFGLILWADLNEKCDNCAQLVQWLLIPLLSCLATAKQSRHIVIQILISFYCRQNSLRKCKINKTTHAIFFIRPNANIKDWWMCTLNGKDILWYTLQKVVTILSSSRMSNLKNMLFLHHMLHLLWNVTEYGGDQIYI